MVMTTKQRLVNMCVRQGIKVVTRDTAETLKEKYRQHMVENPNPDILRALKAKWRRALKWDKKGRRSKSLKISGKMGVIAARHFGPHACQFLERHFG